MIRNPGVDDYSLVNCLMDLSKNPSSTSKKRIVKPSQTPIPPNAGIDPQKLQAIISLAERINSLMPNAKLSTESVVKVAAVLVLMGEEFVELAVESFSKETSLQPGTTAYNRAEFFNVWWFLARMTGTGSVARHEPYFLATYDILDRLGVGPLAPFHSARAQLREIVARVRRSLDPHSTLREAWKRKTLSHYPVIAKWLPRFDSLVD